MFTNGYTLLTQTCLHYDAADRVVISSVFAARNYYDGRCLRGRLRALGDGVRRSHYRDNQTARHSNHPPRCTFR